eukprot:TRINITY_DN8536_c0_g1_i1.p1 TRINITY_DN8536_c0_g1~~TRINITY_DN8536_c0_g1_i1.p1  ORF type:complete len:708 (-),score=147.88 TRINITY_DN8536_c0_g1_i1:140-2062(-)
MTKKIRRLRANFVDLSEDTIREVLEKNEYDEDSCILPLFEMVQVVRAKKEKAKIEQERRAREERERESQRGYLKLLFGAVPDAILKEKLEASKGDLDKAVEAINQMISEEEKKREKNVQKKREQEAEQARKQQQLIHDKFVENLCLRFYENIQREEVIACLEKNNWDGEASILELGRMCDARKVEYCAKLMGSHITSTEIVRALKEHKGETAHALAALNSLKRKRLAAIRAKEIEEIREAEANQEEPSQPVLKKKETPAPVEASSSDEEDELYADDYSELAASIHQDVQDTIKKMDINRPMKELILDTQDNCPPCKPEMKQPVPKQAPPVSDSQSTTESVIPQEQPAKGENVTQVGDGDVTLTLNKDWALVGEEIEVSWDCKEGHTTSDWIAMYRAGVNREARKYLTYQYVPTAKGKLSFTAVNKYGFFEFRYFRGRSGYVLKASSPSFGVGPNMSMTVSQPEETVLLVTLAESSNVPMFKQLGWVGLFPEGADNSSYIQYFYLNAAADGPIKFEVPKSGSYSVRYFPGNYYASCSTSITIGGEDTLKMTENMETDEVEIEYSIATKDPAADSVWIGIFFQKETNNKMWRRSGWVTSKSGQLTFPNLKHYGKYEARLFADGKYDVLARSNAVEIEGIIIN